MTAEQRSAWFRTYLSVGSGRVTAVFWLALGLMAASLFIPRLLPMVDYPQHLGMAEILRRLFDASAPEHQSFSANWFTYNALFHLLTALLGSIVGVETAGRMVVGLALVGLGGAVLALLKALRRPPWYAALFVPAIFSTSVAWGFINYSLGMALTVTTLVLVVRMLERPRLGLALGIAAMGLLLGFSHVLAMAILCILAVSFAPELGWRASAQQGLDTRGRAKFAFKRAFMALAPLTVGGLYCVAAFLRQYAWAPSTYSDPTLEGTMPSIWKKLAFFPSWTTGVNRDKSDSVLVGIALLVCLAILISVAYRRRERLETRTDHRPGSPLLLPLIAMATSYFAVPMVFIGTHMIFPRLGQMVVFGLILALPEPGGRMARVASQFSLLLALVTSLNVCFHMAWFARETDDASRVIDHLPPGRRVASVMYDQGTESYRKAGMVHIAAYYAARHGGGGDWAYNFARYASVPLNFQPGTQPAWPARGWEFSPRSYNPRCLYARAYDVVIVGAPRHLVEADQEIVAGLVFGRDAHRVRVLAREGRFWAFDTAGLPSDGSY